LDEVREAAVACAHITVPDPPPGYLQPFLVERLADKNPALAKKVAELDVWQFTELFGIIRSMQHRRAVTRGRPPR
jgi:hypothetical protein